MQKLSIFAAAALLALGGLAFAENGTGHAGMDADDAPMGDMAAGDAPMGSAEMGAMGPASAGFAAAMAAMDAGMQVPMTGDADVDFAAMMIPHHQGAIDMARVELEHGTDPELRKLAQDIVAAQETEIAFMRQWLAAHGR